MTARLTPWRIYIETSVIGGCLDDEFKEASLRLLDMVQTGTVHIVLSNTTLNELASAPTEVRGVLATVPDNAIEYVYETAESIALAREYLAQEVLPGRMLADALHIALATVAKVDVLVSWNFKHIVNLNRIHGYNSVNVRAGYPMIEIRSPLEMRINED